MILDAFLQFTGSTTPNAADSITSTGDSSNELDLHMAGIPVLSSGQGARDVGIGDSPALKLLVQVSTAFVSAGGATLQVAIQGAQDNGSGAAGSYTVWWLSPAYTVAQLVAGARLYDMDMPRPPQGVAIPRFLKLRYVVAVSTFSAGALKGFLILDRMDQPYLSTNNAVMGGYPAGINIAN